MSVYRPVHVTQFDHSRLENFNCTCASAAMALDRHTLGLITTTGGHLRSCQFDQSGGTDLTDMAIAWLRCYSRTLDNPGAIAWTDFIRHINEGRGAIITGRYGSLSSQYRHQSGFFDNHAMYVNEVNPQGWLLNYDPIWHQSQWLPASELKRFAGALRTSRGSLGYGLVYGAYTRITAAGANTLPPPAPLPHNEVNVMIAEGGLTVTSSHVMNLKKDTVLYKTTAGTLIGAKMAKDARVPYMGIAGVGWRVVQVKTGNPYADKVARPTLLYVHASAGTVELR